VHALVSSGDEAQYLGGLQATSWFVRPLHRSGSRETRRSLGRRYPTPAIAEPLHVMSCPPIGMPPHLAENARRPAVTTDASRNDGRGIGARERCATERFVRTVDPDCLRERAFRRSLATAERE
jgi:hypothetical protein